MFTRLEMVNEVVQKVTNCVVYDKAFGTDHTVGELIEIYLKVSEVAYGVALTYDEIDLMTSKINDRLNPV